VDAPEALLLTEPGSSQEVSALLLTLAAWPGERRLEVRGAIPSRPYVDLTVGVLASFGVGVDETVTSSPGGEFRVTGTLRAPDAPLAIEPDASGAAVALAAGCLSGGRVEIDGLTLDSPQGDTRVVEHLRAFGCAAGQAGEALYAEGRPTRGALLDLSGEPDLAPPLAAVAAGAAQGVGARSRLEGLGTLPGKESSRIEVLAEGLARLGFAVRADDESLEVGPGEPSDEAALLDPRGDHRMAFAFALLGLLRAGVEVGDAGCVAKSWPTFWSDLAAAGARLAR